MPLIIRTTGFEDFLDPSGESYLKALIMGDHGVGKTPSACNWPQPILADCEKGRLSVASMAVPYAEILNSQDMDALLDRLRMECMKPPEKRQWRTLVVDTVDTYQRKLIQERLKSERKEAFSGRADWGWLDGKMIQLIEKILNLPMNVVVNMHTKDVSDEDGDESRLVQKARLKGDFKDAIFQDFDLIGHMEQSYELGTGDKKGERVRVRQIRWHSEPKFPALRDRSNKLPRFTDVDFTPGDFQRIFDAITSGLDDYPESVDVETLSVEGDTEGTPPADVSGGPVDEAAVPAPKAPAKRAAAKKAPAAKKAAATPEPTPEPAEPVAGEPAEAPAEDPWTPPVEDAPTVETATDVDAAAEEALKEGLGAEVVAEELPDPEPEPTPEPEPAKAPAAKAAEPKAARCCGDQPESMVGKFPAKAGCGVELNADNAGKAQISLIKFRTYLCDEDFAKAQAAA